MGVAVAAVAVDAAADAAVAADAAAADCGIPAEGEVDGVDDSVAIASFHCDLQGMVSQIPRIKAALNTPKNKVQ